MNRRQVSIWSTLGLCMWTCLFPVSIRAEEGSWSDADRADESKGDHFYQENDFVTAEGFYRDVRDLHPDSPAALLYHVKGLIGLGRYPEALEESRKAAALAPDYALAPEWIGISLAHLGRYDEAVSAFKKSLELGPDEETTSVWLAGAYFMTGDHQKAEQMFDQLLLAQDKENQPQTLDRIADVFHQMGDDSLAIDWWKRSAAMGDKSAARYLSWVYSSGNVPVDAGESAYWSRAAGDSFAWFHRLSFAGDVIKGSRGWILVVVAIFSAAILPLLTIGLVAVSLGRGLTTNPSIHWTERARRSYPFQVILGSSVLLPFIYAASVSFFPASMLPVSKWLLGGVVFVVGTASTNFMAVILATRYRENPESYFRNLQNVASLLILYAPYICVFIIMSFFLPQDWGLQAALVIGAAILAYFWIHFGGWIRLGRILFLVFPAGPELTSVAGALAREHGNPEPSVWMFRWRKANAFAFIFSNAIVVTEKLRDLLNPEEMKAILAHELAHLREDTQTRLTLLLTPLLTLSIFTMYFWIGSEIWYVLLSYAILIIGLVVLKKTRRRMEETADAFGKKMEGETGTYARALARLYEANLIPAVMPGKRKAHPHLYDRLASAGIIPDYPRPDRPPRWGLPMVLFILAANVIGLTAIWLLLF